MRNVQPDMNVDKQRRKFMRMIDEAPDAEHRKYLGDLLNLFEEELAADRPTPASQFIPMYWEEFDIEGGD